MSLLGHHFLKDIRRLFVPLALWALLLILPLVLASALGERMLFSPGNPFHQLLEVADFAMIVLFWALTVALSAWVVLEDPPKGTTAFWLTRPLSRGTVTAEKFCLLAVIALAPAIFRMIVVALAGADPAQVGIEGLSVALWHAPVVLAAAAFAVTAETFGEFITTGILSLIGAGIVSAIVITVITISRLSKSLVSSYSAGSAHAGLGDSRLLAAQVSIAAMAAAIVGWRYTRRHVRLVLLAVAVATVASVLIPTYWRWNLFAGRGPAPAIGNTSSLEFNGRIKLRDSDNGNRPPTWLISTGAKLLPSGDTAIPVELRGIKLASTAGNSVQIPSSGSIVSPGRAEAYEPAALASALPGIAVLNLPKKRLLTLAVDARIQQSLNRLGLGFSALTATATTDICRFENSAELPLRNGSHGSYGFRRLILTDVDAGDSGADIDLQEGSIDSYLAAAIENAARHPVAVQTRVQAGKAVSFSSSVTKDFPPTYCLVNRARGQAVLANGNRGTPARSVGDYQLQNIRLHFDFSQLPAPIDAAWLKQAVLVRLQLKTLGTAEAPFRATESDL